MGEKSSSGKLLHPVFELGRSACCLAVTLYLLSSLGPLLDRLSIAPTPGDSLAAKFDALIRDLPVREISVSSDGATLDVIQGDAQWCRRDALTGQYLFRRAISEQKLFSVNFDSERGLWAAAHHCTELQIVNPSTTFWSGLCPGQNRDEGIADISLCRERPLVTALSDRGNLWLIDFEEHPVTPRLSPLGRSIVTVSLSPTGERLALITQTGELQIRNVRAPCEALSRTMRNGHCRFACWSGDGRRIMTFGGNCNIVVWDIEAATELDQFPIEHGSAITAAALSSDGALAAIAAFNSIRLWSIGEDELPPLHGHGGKVSVMTFANHDTTLYSGDYFGEVRRWDVAHQKEVWSVPE